MALEHDMLKGNALAERLWLKFGEAMYIVSKLVSEQVTKQVSKQAFK